jgi:ATP-dependent protease ClpP protease subunit
METPDFPPSATLEQRSSYLEEKAFKSRTLLIFGAITDQSAADVARRLIALDADSQQPIDILVSSPGGHLESGDAIHDIVRFISAPVNMIGTGWVGSAATHLYLAVPRERRFCLPNTRFLIHQPSGRRGRAGQRHCHPRARDPASSHTRRPGDRARDRQAAGRRARRHRTRPMAVGGGGDRLRPGVAHHPAQGRVAKLGPVDRP